ncbi:Deuterolysin metalloprotease family protein, partial [Metarhizium brunneum ARSEF 3297]
MAFTQASAMALSTGGRAASPQDGTRALLDVTLDQDSVAEHGVYNGTGCAMSPEQELELQKRASETQSCYGLQDELDAALEECVKLSNLAAEAASGAAKGLKSRDGNEQKKAATLDNFFGISNSDEVADNFRRIARGCSKDKAKGISITCAPREECTLQNRPRQQYAATATIRNGTTGSIRLCRKAFQMPATAGNARRRLQVQGQQECGQSLSSLAQLFVHEMAHTTFAADDLTYDKRKSLNLDENKQKHNADNYALFARDIANDCPVAGTGGENQPNRPNRPNGPGDPGSKQGPPKRPSGSGNSPSNRPPSGGNRQPKRPFTGSSIWSIW